MASNIRSIIFVHGLWGHPKHTWETTEAVPPLVRGDDNDRSLESTGRKNSFAKIMRSVSFQKLQYRKTPTSTSIATTSLDDAFSASVGLSYWETPDSDEMTARPKKVFWPRDLLPLDIPEARILTYGYDADVIGSTQNDSTKLNNLTTHAQDLLAKLDREMKNEVNQDLDVLSTAN
jgi:hypothetical protein